MNIAIVCGNDTIETAKMIGMTPAIEIFSGMCVLCPPYIFRPTTRFAYCTGILRSASFIVTTKPIAMTAIARIATNVTTDWKDTLSPENSVACNERIIAGPRETIPVKMISEIPLPIPFSVISSPSHIKNAVPAVSVAVTIMKFITELPPEM